MQGFALISESKEISVSTLQAFAVVLSRYSAAVCAQWQRTALPVSACIVGGAPKDPDIVLVSFADELTDPNALAYHTEMNGQPCIFVGAGICEKNCPGSDWVGGPDSLLVAASHEIAETIVNPNVNLWVDRGTSEEALEICDWVQGDSYIDPDGPSGMYVSNFCHPRFFSSRPASRFDAMGLCGSAWELRPGGYHTPRTGGPTGTTTQVFGARPSEGGMAQWKRDAKLIDGTRARRIAAQAGRFVP